MEEEERRAVGELIASGIETLRERIAEMEDAARPVSPDNAIGRLSRVDAMSSRQISKSTLFALKSKLSRLEYLSEKINEPDFGMCARCGRQIPVKRLMAIPETTMCVQCAAG
ncbi:TraR/DksA family transcriptional regulator [Desulfoferrobacter suflitae]|uniref:TraR/DksA family transcriptional regulator n=1 Tax=Desulfoferrobacter suflitae TaxID=2865782 RepID=UPI0021643CB0|nr:TraR/DksA C4-type zinc finger protein [Desulfoferrobacter suflitae]MCK8603654.1 TraR/DksA C4-type zinc finger protein [Desulfoferrobacter suflitae]